jgi:hypothetical protein
VGADLPGQSVLQLEPGTQDLVSCDDRVERGAKRVDVERAADPVDRRDVETRHWIEPLGEPQ